MSKTSSVDSTIITIVKSEGTNSRATQSFTSEVLSDNSHRFSVSGESSTFKPTALYDMYSPLLSPHQATPSSDLELTPRPSPPTTPQVHTSVGMETNAHTSDDSTLVTNTTSVQATNLIDMATPKYLDDASLTTESSPNKSIRVDQETVVENKEISNGSVALLVNISSRINDLLKMVESVSARVDLVETQMKTLHDVTSAQDRIANTDTTHVQKSVTNSSNVDTPHILQCKQSAHSQQLIMDHTHAHTQLTYTPHRAYISSSPVSTYDVTASPSVSHTKQTTHSQPLSVHSTTPSTPVSNIVLSECYLYFFFRKRHIDLLPAYDPELKRLETFFTMQTLPTTELRNGVQCSLLLDIFQNKYPLILFHVLLSKL